MSGKSAADVAAEPQKRKVFSAFHAQSRAFFDKSLHFAPMNMAGDSRDQRKEAAFTAGGNRQHGHGAYRDDPDKACGAAAAAGRFRLDLQGTAPRFVRFLPPRTPLHARPRPPVARAARRLIRHPEVAAKGGPRRMTSSKSRNTLHLGRRPSRLARSQVYAGCVNLPAMLAPQGDDATSALASLIRRTFARLPPVRVQPFKAVLRSGDGIAFALAQTAQTCLR